jgi:SMC interacting uncharacterized protein involved in chromosome segregation
MSLSNASDVTPVIPVATPVTAPLKNEIIIPKEKELNDVYDNTLEQEENTSIQLNTGVKNTSNEPNY